jgi:hypothetical protein
VVIRDSVDNSAQVQYEGKKKKMRDAGLDCNALMSLVNKRALYGLHLPSRLGTSDRLLTSVVYRLTVDVIEGGSCIVCVAVLEPSVYAIVGLLRCAS